MKKSSKSKGVVISLSEILNSFDGDVFVKPKKKKNKAKKQSKPSLPDQTAMFDALRYYMRSPLAKEPADAVNEAPAANTPIDVSDLPYVTAEEVAKYPDLLRSDWEKFNWSRALNKKYFNRQTAAELVESIRTEPGKPSNVPNGQSAQLFIITGTDGNGDEPIPLSRGSNAPLTWSRLSSDDIGTCYPIPQVFDLSTAEELVRQQREYDNKRDAGVDAMIMHIIPVCTDPAYVAQID